jgi:hypothetical protein
MIRIGRKAVVAGAAILTLATGSGVAAAAVMSGGPVDGSGVIHGCWSNRAFRGSHRFVMQNAGTNCPKGTTAISWNAAGPQGPTGPSGPAGPAGPAGPPGRSGISGVVTERKDISLNWGAYSDGDAAGAEVACPSGDVVLNGGYGFTGADNGEVAEKWIPVSDAPIQSDGIWYWDVVEFMTGTPYTPPAGQQANWYLSVFVVCAPSG